MKRKRLLSLICSFILTLNLITVPILANEVMPCWENIFCVDIVHGLDDGKACCYIFIDTYTGTDLIDNVDIKLYQKIGNALILVKRWDDLSATGESFTFYEEVDGVDGGYIYRLAVTADVHRNGYTEQLDTYGDVQY